MSDALFDMDPVPEEPPRPGEKLSRDRRRTIRQAQALARRAHPLALVFGPQVRLHPDAPLAGDRQADGPRCGTCAFRRKWGEHSFPKCTFGVTPDGDYPRASHGAATDVRAWWGACTDWTPKSPVVTP